VYNLKVLGAVGFRADNAAFGPRPIIAVSTLIFGIYLFGATNTDRRKNENKSFH